jgi:hypothetical protein
LPFFGKLVSSMIQVSIGSLDVIEGSVSCRRVMVEFGG